MTIIETVKQFDTRVFPCKNTGNINSNATFYSGHELYVYDFSNGCDINIILPSHNAISHIGASINSDVVQNSVKNVNKTVLVSFNDGILYTMINSNKLEPSCSVLIDINGCLYLQYDESVFKIKSTTSDYSTNTSNVTICQAINYDNASLPYNIVARNINNIDIYKPTGDGYDYVHGCNESKITDALYKNGMLFIAYEYTLISYGETELTEAKRIKYNNKIVSLCLAKNICDNVCICVHCDNNVIYIYRVNDLKPLAIYILPVVANKIFDIYRVNEYGTDYDVIPFLDDYSLKKIKIPLNDSSSLRDNLMNALNGLVNKVKSIEDTIEELTAK